MPHLSALSLALNRPGAVSLEQVVASLFANNEQGAWYDPSAANVTWRRNLLTRTEEFDNADWPKLDNAISVTANATTAPDGTATADALYETAVTQEFTIQRLAVNTQGVSACISIYAKAGTRRRIALGMTSTGGVASVNWVIFDLIDKNVVANAGAGTAFNIQEVAGTGGWCRLHISKTVVDGSSDRFVVQICRDSDTTPPAAYLGDVGNYLYVWGAQSERGVTPTAYQRIVTPEITYLADVQSQPLLFTDAAGTTPVVGVESPVGLILDKRKGATLGAELVDTANTTAPWVTSAAGNNLIAQDGDVVRFTYVDSLYGQELRIDQTGGLSANLVVGSWYQIKFKAKVNTGSVQWALRTLAGAFATGFPITVNSTDYTEYSFVYNHVAGGNPYAGLYIYNSFGAGEIAWIKDISFRLLDGNHAYQTGSTARPVLRARYNLLQYSEQFDNGYWSKGTFSVTANNALAPDQTNTADLLTESSNTSLRMYSAQVPNVAGQVFSASVYLKYQSRRYVQFICGSFSNCFGVIVDLVGKTITGTGSYGSATYTSNTISDVGNDWVRVIITGSVNAVNNAYHVVSSTDGSAWTGTPAVSVANSAFYIWGADLRVGTSAGDYQRIAAATDYATTSTITGQPFRPYLAFDGSDDRLITASVDFSATDEMAVCFGLAKQTDANRHVFAHLGNLITNTFRCEAPYVAASNSYAFFSTGSATLVASQIAGASYAAPQAVVFTGQANISDDVNIMRINGSQVASSTNDQGTGNFANGQLTFGMRTDGSLFFNGYMYGWLVIGRVITAGELGSLERYIAGKTGVTL